MGIHHKSDKREHAGQPWEPVRAIASHKVFYLRRIEFETEMGTSRQGQRGLAVSEAFPDTEKANLQANAKKHANLKQGTYALPQPIA